MTAPEPKALEVRKKRTVWLLAGGAASLLIPLAGAIYLHVSENAGAPGPSGRSDLFEPREGADRKITPTQAVVPPSSLMTPPRLGMAAGAVEKPAASSLDFIKSNGELNARVADSNAAAPSEAAAPVAAVAESTVSAKPGKPAKKVFSMPKLQPSRGFTSFGSGNGSKSAAKGGGAGAQDMLKNLPPGAENDPRIQQYLKSR